MAPPPPSSNGSLGNRLVKINVHEGIGTVILNRPAKCNPLSRQLMQDLAETLEDLRRERPVRSVVLTGAGTAFCAGMDLQEMQAAQDLPNAHEQWHEDTEQYRALLEQMWRFPKPLIAAVNGPALAGGLGLVLACDFAVGAEDATLGLPEARRGLVAGMVIPLLCFRVGGAHAARLVLTAETVSAEEAMRYGLLQETHPEPKVWARAIELARACSLAPEEVLQLSKRVLNETVGEHLPTLLAAGAAASATSRTTEAAAEGLVAFLEKRAPRWP